MIMRIFFCLVFSIVCGRSILFAEMVNKSVPAGGTKSSGSQVSSAGDPWPTLLGSPSGSKRGNLPGPTKGLQKARWEMKKGNFTTPAVISKSGEIFVGSSLGILRFSANLEPIGDPVNTGSFVQSISLSSDGSILTCNNKGAFRIKDGSAQCIVRPGEKLYKYGLKGLLEAPNGNLVIWDSSMFSECSPDGKILWTASPSKELGGTIPVHAAINENHQIFFGTAFSYSNEDEPTEYFGCLLASDKDGKIFIEKEKNRDNLPTSTGSYLQLQATREGVYLNDNWIAFYDLKGKERWRYEKSFWVKSAVLADGSLVFADHQSIRHFDPASGKDFEIFQCSDSPSNIYLDSQNNIYAVTGRGIEACTESGKHLFKIAGSEGGDLSLGNGFGILVERKGIISRIE